MGNGVSLLPTASVLMTPTAAVCGRVVLARRDAMAAAQREAAGAPSKAQTTHSNRLSFGHMAERPRVPLRPHKWFCDGA
ncbi:hypothetical protein GCM10017643_38670 [Ancylobacter dichloromethanicus]|uniref:Uncharacterized protein n=1 Tax=Ancylobacter dichloromethanicus TaxID=518825 RepID=A0A9W6N0F8_9HYPH|nr:hypothetical protein GCM10017643_38670 [Ancylobacter dichloromethanicus]